MRNLKNFCVALMLGVSLWVNAAGIPRPEYPRPQFERQSWVNLNGNQWTYEFDFGKSGHERQLNTSKGFAQTITVPFCPESPLSGVGHKDFIDAMWYHRQLDIPADWKDKRVILHFGGVDFKSTIYINGKEAFVHYGGAASFSVDITRYATPGERADLVVAVEDDVRSRMQPGGKQSRQLNSYSCFYTRVTGIWATVWMEGVAKNGLRTCRITPDLDNSLFVFEPAFYATDGAATFTVNVLDGTRVVASAVSKASDNAMVVTKIKNAKLWSPESPFLYDVEYIVKDAKGKVIDRVKSYAGMRKAELRDKTFYLNNKPYYQRLVLDQGYYPDGQWTAPTDEALRRDIELGKQSGFNGARLHQKVFEERYFYWADKLGYLTWGESPSWEMDWTSPVAARNMIDEWTECVERDYNKTSLVVWSPLNETWQDEADGQRQRLSRDLYFMTKRLDRTRPVATTSGGYHAGFDDIYTEHTYVQDPVELYNQLKPIDEGKAYTQWADKSWPWQGEPYMIDEFGGIRWVKQMQAAEVAPEGSFWGYGADPKSLEEYYDRLEGQVDAVLSVDNITGFCYTQIVDVELEKNGIFTYDRDAKFDMGRIHRIFTKSREQAKKDMEKRLKARTAQQGQN